MTILSRHLQPLFAFALVFTVDLSCSASCASELRIPDLVMCQPAAGLRVRQTLQAYQATQIHHTLYLPTDWEKGKRYPVIVEYAGNQYQSSLGTVEGCSLGYGISGGQGVIWVCLPFVDSEKGENALRWWGDVAATVDYCKMVVAEVCDRYRGNPNQVFIAGFSRGAIACNYIGLHDDSIAKLWRGFICHSHYDGVRAWPYPGSDRASAAERLARLGHRPQFISHEDSVEATRAYLATVATDGNFTFVPIAGISHTDTWVLDDLPERSKLREWFKQYTAGE